METIPSVSKPNSAPPTSSNLLEYLDGLLRNREDYFARIFEGQEIGKNLFYLFLIVIGLSVLYGFMMGASKGLSPQLFASAIKVPILYLLTLLVCYPVLYVVIVIMGSKLTFLQTFALIMLAIALNSILLASCAPIVLFFTLTGADYDFLKLLHVTIFTFSGAWGMAGLWRGLQAMCEKSELYPKQTIKILRIWVLVFAFVGTQMAWSLRPFIGSPGLEFQIFRTDQTGNFYQAVWRSVVSLSQEKSKSLGY